MVNLAGSASALFAAAWWWRASRIDVPPFPDVGFDSDTTVFEPVRQALQRASALNATAAAFAAIAALCGAGSFFL